MTTEKWRAAGGFIVGDRVCWFDRGKHHAATVRRIGRKPEHMISVVWDDVWIAVARGEARAMRSIRVGTETWQWSVGRRGGTVVLFPPEGHGRKLVLTSEDVTGLPPEVVARGQWKRTSNGSVTPSHIRAFIDSLTPCAYCGKRREVVVHGTPCFGYGSLNHKWMEKKSKHDDAALAKLVAAAGVPVPLAVLKRTSALVEALIQQGKLRRRKR